jgi:ketosteroid isomerase-like protein
MAESENVQVVKDAYEAFKREDLPGLLEIFSEDIDWQTPGSPDAIPYAGNKRGRDEVTAFFVTLAETEEITHFEPREFIAQGERVVVLGNYKGRIRSNKREFDLDWLHIFTVNGGKITSFREFVDTAALADAHRGTSAQAAG